jgi:hypothetical protein
MCFEAVILSKLHMWELWDTDIRLTGQKILWKFEDQYLGHKRPEMDHIPSEMNPIQTFKPHFFAKLSLIFEYEYIWKNNRHKFV